MVSSKGSKKFFLQRPKKCLFQESKRFLFQYLKDSFSIVYKIPGLKGLKDFFSRVKKVSSQESKRFLCKSLNLFYVKGLKGPF